MEMQMPHLVIEHSGNLVNYTDMDVLCRALHATLLDSGLFEAGAIRVRALSSVHYAIADQLVPNAFADLSLRIGTGRSSEDKARIGEAIMAAAKASLVSVFQSPNFALSLEIREIDTVFSWRDNTMHTRLRSA
jgi:5-carboxymethyl-2-hydroxymuconate isomerase